MSFVNLEQAIDRERRMEQLMVRLGSLPPEDFNKISQMIQARAQIDSIVTSTTASVGGGPAVARQMESTLAKSGETITSNLTQLLGFVPTSSDMSELKLMNERFGSNFSEATRTISSSIGSIEGGVGKLLQSLDTGVTQGIQSLATAAQNSLNDLKQQATDAAKGLLPPINSILPSSTLSALSSFSSVGSSITGLLSDANKLATSLTTLVQDQVNQGAKQVTGLLDNISKDISGQVSGFINSQVTSSQFGEIKKLTSSTVSVPPTPPVPLDANGEDFPSIPIVPGTDLNSAPVALPTTLTDPLRASARGSRSEETIIDQNQYVSRVFFPTGTGGRYIPVILRIVSRRNSNEDYIIRLSYFDIESNAPARILRSVTTVAIRLGNPRAVRAFYTNLQNIPVESLATISPTAVDNITAPSSFEEIVNSFAIPRDIITREDAAREGLL